MKLVELVSVSVMLIFSADGYNVKMTRDSFELNFLGNKNSF